MERLHFEDQIARNKLKSWILIFIIMAFFLLLGYIISQIYNPGAFFGIMIISIIISLIYVVASYYNSAKLALYSANAKPASQTEHRMLFHAVESMSIASGLPMPKVYVMESEQINAFASGRNPENAVICFTTGALKKLNKQELEGVVAHEMGHIANFDIRFITLTAVLVGMISIAAEIFLRSLWFSGSKDRDGKSQLLLIIIGIALAILAPIAAQLVSLAISRKREFTADATAVKFTRYSPGLKSALQKIKNDSISSEDKRHYAKAMAPLFISNPFSKANAASLLSTHPPVEERIKRLEAM